MPGREALKVHRIGFTQLSSGDSSQSGSHKANIIFVHGLRGHPQTTWEDRPTEKNNERPATSSKRSSLRAIFHPKRPESIPLNTGNLSIEHDVFWPRDYLAEDISEARIWTYGYNADVIGDVFQANNQNSISQHGEDLKVKIEREIEGHKPIIFVTHSLGGIIAKDAIRRSDICQSRTKLVVFLGTPHQGSDYAGWGIIASYLASLALQDSNKYILRSLKNNGEVLDNIQTEFRRIVYKNGINVHSFYEARPISGIKGFHGKVVGDSSSKVGLPDETVESIDANHMQMARCSDKEDPQYRAIMGVLKKFFRDSLHCGDQSGVCGLNPVQSEADTGAASGKTRESQNKSIRKSCYSIPFPRNSRFSGRDAILNEIRERLFIQKECQRLAVVGLGGVGKTQVALELAYRLKDSQPEYSIFWVPALSDGSFEQAYTEIARRLEIRIDNPDQDPKEAVRQYLESETAGKWLLIVDNADDTNILFGSSDESNGMDEYLPRSNNGMTLFTTRSREVAVSVAVNDVIVLQEMDLQEATSFFEKMLIQKQLLQDSVMANNLLEKLTYLPLAISQAAAYLNVNQISLEKYLDLLQGTEQDMVSLLSREFRDNTRYRDTQNAVASTWLVSFDQIRRSNTVAADLLSFVSCIEYKAIPQSILPEPPSNEELENAIGVLCGYAFFVRRGNDDIFDMHRLVHLAVRVWLQKRDAVTQTKASAIQHLALIFPWNDQENRALCREYLPHTLCALRGSEDFQSDERSDLFYRVGACLNEDRRFKEAVEFLEKTYHWRKHRLSEEDPDRVASEFGLARAYLDNRQVKEAIKIFKHVVATCKKTLAEEDHSRLASEHELGRAYLNNQQIKEAIKILEHVVAIHKKTLAEEDLDRVASEHMLASAYLDNRQIKEATKIFEHVVAIRKKTLAEGDYSRLVSEHELARAYLDNQQIKEAIKIFEHVVAIRKKTLAEEDHSRLASEHELASAYLNDRQIKEAIKILEHVVAIRKKTLAEEDCYRLSSEHELARAYLDNRQIKEAIKIFKHVVVVEKSLDMSNEDRLVSQNLLEEALEML
ncbi:hypothetical protein GGR54DRAFT_591476 [Hypoxylon sp. NC1633]|nr:hypothetical protein GGR54DRAFT_591476 [Hypoxylon sp. NC1633]